MFGVWFDSDKKEEARWARGLSALAPESKQGREEPTFFSLRYGCALLLHDPDPVPSSHDMVRRGAMSDLAGYGDDVSRAPSHAGVARREDRASRRAGDAFPAAAARGLSPRAVAQMVLAGEAPVSRHDEQDAGAPRPARLRDKKQGSHAAFFRRVWPALERGDGAGQPFADQPGRGGDARGREYSGASRP